MLTKLRKELPSHVFSFIHGCGGV